MVNEKRENRMRKKGLKPFLFGDNHWVWALNQENAVRKYKKFKLREYEH